MGRENKLQKFQTLRAIAGVPDPVKKFLKILLDLKQDLSL